MFKWVLGLGIVWLLYRQGQGSVSQGAQSVLQNTPLGPALDVVGKTIDGAATYVTAANGSPAVLNVSPTGPYGTMGPDGTGIDWNPQPVAPPGRVIDTMNGKLVIDAYQPSRFLLNQTQF